MKYQTIVDMKDEITLRKILDIFPEAQRSAMRPQVKAALQQATLEWQNELVPEMLPEREVANFRHTMNESISPS